MLSKLQLRTLLLHEFKIGHSAADTTQNIIEAWGKETTLDRTVHRGQKWINYNNKRLSAQWLDIHEPPKDCRKRNLHQKKVMILVWWSKTGLIHYKFLKQGVTIKSESYCTEIDEMYNKLKIQHPALINRKGVILLHYNARPHVSKVTLQKLNSLDIEVLPHPSYLPDLSPLDYHFFKHLDHFLQDKVFNNGGAAKLSFEEFILSSKPDFFQTGINNLFSRCEKNV